MGRIVEYAIVRFVPETFRGEFINIGLVAFRDYDLDVRLYPQSSMFKALGVDPATLEWFPDLARKVDDSSLSVEQRWESLRRIPGFALSERGWLAADTTDEYEIRIDRIFADYINRPKIQKVTKRATTLVRELRQVFREYHVMGKNSDDIARHKVISNMAVGPAGKLHVDFVVKNGVYHATETADFRTAHDAGTSELKEAAFAAITLQCARVALGPEGTKCYFVYSASPLVETVVSPALQQTEPTTDHKNKQESNEQRRAYLDLILAAAGSPSLFRSN